jgi:O-antigen/teichoic acid export membrane protein
MKGTIFFASAMVVERLISFFLLPILTKLVTPVEYAIWSQSVIISGMMIPIVLLGFQTAVVKFIPLWDNQEKSQHSVILFMLISILTLFSLIAATALYFDSSVALLIFGSSEMSFYVPLLIGLLFSEALFEFLVGILRATNRIRRVSTYLLMKGMWRIGTIILVLIGMNGDFYTAFWLFVSFQLVVTLLIYAKEVKLITLLRSGLDIGKHHWNEVLRFSLPLVPFAVLLGINTFVDRLFITHSHDLEMLATYSAGSSLVAIIAFFYSVLGFTLFPELSKRWADGNKDGAIILLRKVIIVYLSLLLPFIVFMVIAGSDILLILTTKDYIISADVLFLLSCNIGLFGLYQISFYFILLQRGSAHAPLLVAIVSGINILFNALLVPKYGMLGAAIAGFISNSFLAIVAIYLSQKSLQWQFPWEASIRILMRALFMGLIIWLGMGWFGDSPIILTGILSVAGIVYGVLDYLDKRNSFFSIIMR